MANEPLKFRTKTADIDIWIEAYNRALQGGRSWYDATIAADKCLLAIREREGVDG